MNSNPIICVYHGEQFSPHFGGALTTWTHKVYSRLSKFKCVPLSLPTDKPYSTPEPIYYRPSPTLLFLYNRIANRRLRGALDPVKLKLRLQLHQSAARAISRCNASLIHIHNSPEAAIVFRRRFPTTPIILHMNNDHLTEGDTPASKIGQMSIDACTSLACCSNYIASNIISQYGEDAAKKIHIIHNGADHLPDVPRNVGGNARPLRILFVGRLVEDKGVHLLIKSFKEVKKAIPNVELRIVGSAAFGSQKPTNYTQSLKELASPLENSIHFTGPIAHDRIVNEYQNADIFACPSIWNDPFPLVSIEALASGLAIVASNRGGIPEALEDAGILFDPTSSTELTNALILLASNCEMREQYSRMAKKRFRDNFTWEQIGQKWEGHIHKLLSDCLNIEK